jgi:putative ABC transport system permease protein
MVIGEALRLGLLGLALGTVVAAALTGTIRHLLYGIAPAAPVSYLGGAGCLLAIVLAASLLPARRAARVDPLVALRAE